MIQLIKLFIIIIFPIFIIGCSKHGYKDRYGPFYVQNNTTVFMDGDMGNNIDNKSENLIEDYPNIELMTFGECPGSRNDESMIRATTLLRNSGINTHLHATSIIESGAVVFYLAGNSRTRESGSLIGIHTWSDGNKSATDYPVGHSEHQLYIDHYIFCGFTVQEAEELYYFIINAAPPGDIHYMTEEEIEEYRIITF